MKEEFDFYNSTSIKSYNLGEKIRYQLKMLDSLDNFTRKHCDNVANITCRLCENLHMSEGFTIYCTTCAYLHDIGKMFIPPAVLQKPGKLTEEEYAIMKTHTTLGYKTCMEDIQLKPYAAGALYHHEGLDGSGYPNAIKGNKIPYEAQIIRVADEFEAITSKRQYKTHVGIVETLNILIEHANPSNENKGLFGPHVGKIDKTILKALLKVVIEDTEYEIFKRSEYIDFLKLEIKRIKLALKEYEKMQKVKSPQEKEFHRQYGKGYLRSNEDLEKTPQVLQELQEAFDIRKAHIAKLYDEIKQIKKLKV